MLPFKVYLKPEAAAKLSLTGNVGGAAQTEGAILNEEGKDIF